MDRISALRNIEDALAAFEAGERTLAELEGDVRGILRTYAADLDGDLRAFRVSGDGIGETVVVAGSSEAAREALADDVTDTQALDVEPL